MIIWPKWHLVKLEICKIALLTNDYHMVYIKCQMVCSRVYQECAHCVNLVPQGGGMRPMCAEV